MDPMKESGDGKKHEKTNEYHLMVTGRVKTSLALGMDELRRMDIVETDDLMIICGEGEPKGQLGRCKGVLLTDIVNLTEVIAPEHNDTKKTYLVASSEDGYKTLFSWQELYNTATGEGVLIIFEKDGLPLYENHSSADLISVMDHLSGPRWVKNIRYIEIKREV
jgi:DMSO/TMAO reductase YedYZ molybdopterin-dependent catalytic subunit